MCPSVQIHVPHPDDFLPSDPWYHQIGKAGQALQSGLEAAGQRRDAQKKARMQHEEDMRRLEIEETRAKASLAKEAGKLAQAGEREADREAVATGLAEIGAAQAGRAREEQVKAAIASPEGLLGPFGMATAMAKGTPDTMAVQQRMAGKIELAKRMSPAAGRAFLERETKAEKQAVLTQAYAEEFKALDNAIKEGVFDDPFGPASKPNAEGEQASPGMAKAQDLAKQLQDGLAAGQQPGIVHKQIVNARDLRSKLLARKNAWTRADVQADKILTQMREIAATMGDWDGELAQRFALAAGEWERTKGAEGVSESYRRETDPDRDLGTLRKLLFGIRSAADPKAMIQEERFAGVLPKDYEPPGPGPLHTGPGRPAVDEGGAPPQAAQAAPGAKRAGGGSVPRGTSAQAQQGGKQAAQIRSVVQAELGKALQQGGAKVDRAASVKAMLDRLEHDLGLDMDDPAVRDAVRAAIQEATGGRH